MGTQGHVALVHSTFHKSSKHEMNELGETLCGQVFLCTCNRVASFDPSVVNDYT